MTISSSLNAGVAALAANASRLAAISDNIANSATYGYKRVETDFQSMVISGAGGSYSAGGVRSVNQRLIDQGGSLTTTANATDLAVRGRGMLPVARASEVALGAGGQQMLLTSTGSFRTDADGILKTESGLVLLGWPANPDGTVPEFPRDTADGLEPVRINVNQLTGEPTTSVNLGLNLPATETDSEATGAAQTLSVEYFDNLGKSENMKIEFSPTIPASGTSNEWTMTLRDSAQGDALIGRYTLTFDEGRTTGGTLKSVAMAGAGGAYDAATGMLIVNVDGGPIEVSIGRLGARDGLTQLSDKFAPLVPLVDLPNPNGLVSLDQQTYMPSPDSGSFFLWDAGAGPTGDIVAFAREESATDVAGELTDMIQTQRAYSSNAKVIQTVDEMLHETTNIKR